MELSWAMSPKKAVWNAMLNACSAPPGEGLGFSWKSKSVIVASSVIAS